MAHPAFNKRPHLEDSGSRRAPRVAPLPFDSATLERQALDTALEGRYRIRKLLGRGGMCTVYLGWDHSLEREVAIKVLSPEYERQLEDRERFRREARIAGSLFHPNIVPVYASERRGGLTYVIMRYVPGESLAALLQREELLPVDTAVEILAGLADALDLVHRLDVVHRDIKPENVLLDEQTGRPMLTDFGVSTVRTSEHSRSEVSRALGTPHYMSPEHALGEQACDGRSDIYSLGVVAYRMLAGRLPFNGASTQSIVAQHVAVEPAPIRYYAPHLSEEQARVIDRCLAKNPAKRWPSAGAFRAALLGAQAERGHRWGKLGTLVCRLIKR